LLEKWESVSRYDTEVVKRERATLAYKPGSVAYEIRGWSFLSEYGRPYSLAAYPRCFRRGRHPLIAYLALLQLGFTVPFMLP
jgi:hypothetical protein